MGEFLKEIIESTLQREPTMEMGWNSHVWRVEAAKRELSEDLEKVSPNGHHSENNGSEFEASRVIWVEQAYSIIIDVIRACISQQTRNFWQTSPIKADVTKRKTTSKNIGKNSRSR